MDGVISTKMWRKLEDIIGETIVEISSKPQVQLLYLAKDYEWKSQELSGMRKSLQRYSKYRQKPEEIIP